jgi:hypothetical protein
VNTLWRIAASGDEQIGAEARQAGLSLEQATALREVINYLRSCAAHPASGAWTRVFAAREVLQGQPTTPMAHPPRIEGANQARVDLGGGPMGTTAIGTSVPRGPAIPFSGKRDAPPAGSALEPISALGNTAPLARPHRDAPLPFTRSPSATSPPSAPQEVAPPPTPLEPAMVPPPAAASAGSQPAPGPSEPLIEHAPPASRPAPASAPLAEVAPESSPSGLSQEVLEPPPPDPPPVAAPPPARSASFEPETIAARMRAAGASETDIAAFLSALRPPPADEEDASA